MGVLAALRARACPELAEGTPSGQPTRCATQTAPTKKGAAVSPRPLPVERDELKPGQFPACARESPEPESSPSAAECSPAPVDKSLESSLGQTPQSQTEDVTSAPPAG